jgi:predicted nucleic acid-binding protein
LTIHGEIIHAPTLPSIIRDDPSDDKFLEAAVAGEASHIISGDKHLPKLSENRGKICGLPAQERSAKKGIKFHSHP